MSMPKDLLFVRHGESEANVIQHYTKNNQEHPDAADVYATPDWQIKLSEKGETQPPIAGKWLLDNLGHDALEAAKKYHSPYLRARQTAALLGIPDGEGWLSDDRVVERSWGIYGTLPLHKQRELFPMTTQHKEVNPWYASLEGGESLASGVLMRQRNLLDSLHREADDVALIVAHGEFMWVARSDLERMSPEEFEELDKDDAQRIRNCSILHYTRVNPEDPEHVEDRIKWMRFIYPDNPGGSPYDGQWRELTKPKYSTAEMLKDQTAAFENKITRE